jgi:hypothetical protein
MTSEVAAVAKCCHGIKKLMEQGFRKPGDAANCLGRYVGCLEHKYIRRPRTMSLDINAAIGLPAE